MNAERWRWMLQTAQISIERAVPHLMGRTPRFRQSILQMLRSNEWEFSEVLASSIGEPPLDDSHQSPEHSEAYTYNTERRRLFSIDTIDYDQLGVEAGKLLDSVEQYASGSPEFDPAIHTNEYKDWDERIDDTIKIIGDIQDFDSDNLILCKNNDGITVGIMSLRWPADLERNPFLYVDHLVTHPGTSGSGEILIEEAVNSSFISGLSGRLRLDVFNRDEFYISVGFRRLDVTMYELDPSRSDAWIEIDGVWMLRRRAHKLEFTTSEVGGSGNQQGRHPPT